MISDLKDLLASLSGGRPLVVALLVIAICFLLLRPRRKQPPPPAAASGAGSSSGGPQQKLPALSQGRARAAARRACRSRSFPR